MGLLTDFVIANASEAVAVCNSENHFRSWPCLEAKQVDNIKLAALWSILSPDAETDTFEGEDYLACTGGDGETWVFLLPDDLQRHLTDLQGLRVREVASRWVEHEELRLDGFTVDDTTAFLNALCDHSRKATEAGKTLLLWMSL